MKILVFGGSGKIGTAVAWDLARDSRVTRIGLVRRTTESFERTRRAIGGTNVALHAVDVADRDEG